MAKRARSVAAPSAIVQTIMSRLVLILGAAAEAGHRSQPAALLAQGYPTTTRACLASHDRLEEGVTGPSWGWAMTCAAAAVRTSASETLVD